MKPTYLRREVAAKPIAGPTTVGDETMGVEGGVDLPEKLRPIPGNWPIDQSQVLTTQDASIVRLHFDSIIVFPRLPILPGLFLLSQEFPVVPVVLLPNSVPFFGSKSKLEYELR
jgi:hypothetical protein